MSDPKRTPTRSDAAVALERAKVARFVSAAFAEPHPVHLAALSRPDVQQELLAAVTALGIDGRLVDAIVSSFLAGRANEDAYNKLLGHTVRSECPPYEMEYRTAEIFQQSQTLADIAGFYRAFGVDATGPLTERADHAATEWEFLAVLSMKEGLARRDEDVECCTAALRAFLEEHAASWMFAFFERIRRADSGSFLAHVADLADVMLRQWCGQLEVAVGRQWLELRPVSEEDSTISCGAAGAVELGPTLAAAMEESE